jgi:hypothetical protein
LGSTKAISISRYNFDPKTRVAGALEVKVEVEVEVILKVKVKVKRDDAEA